MNNQQILQQLQEKMPKFIKNIEIKSDISNKKDIQVTCITTSDQMLSSSDHNRVWQALWASDFKLCPYNSVVLKEFNEANDQSDILLYNFNR